MLLLPPLLLLLACRCCAANAAGEWELCLRIGGQGVRQRWAHRRLLIDSLHRFLGLLEYTLQLYLCSDGLAGSSCPPQAIALAIAECHNRVTHASLPKLYPIRKGRTQQTESCGLPDISWPGPAASLCPHQRVIHCAQTSGSSQQTQPAQYHQSGLYPLGRH